MARCPTHDDRLASLSISTGRKGTVLNCHAGCRTEDIAAALGFTVPQLFNDYEQKQSNDTSATMLLRDMIARSRPKPVRLDWYTLSQVMDLAFSGTVEDKVRAHLFAGDWLDLEFEEAFNMWGITADVAVYPYMERYLRTSGRNWHEVRREAMTKLHTTWRKVTVG
jgi:hypothetical protein